MSTRPPIWVISLGRATDRRAFVKKTFAGTDLDVEIVDAVDGAALGQEVRSVYSPWRAAYGYGRALRPGEVACALSHLSLMQRVIDLDIPEVVVFEDDVSPETGFRELLDARAQFPDDFDVVTFHSLFDWATPRPINEQVLAGRYRIARFAATPMGTQAYLVTQRAARRLVDVGYPVALPADELLFRGHPAGLQVYGIDPTPVRHHEFPSELGAPTSRSADRGVGLHTIRDGALQAAGLAGRAIRRIQELG